MSILTLTFSPSYNLKVICIDNLAMNIYVKLYMHLNYKIQYILIYSKKFRVYLQVW